MKIKNKKNYLLGILLSTLMIVGIINVTNGETRIVTNPDSSKLHTPSLFSLFLGTNDSNSAKMGVNAGGNTLNIRDGLIIGKNHIVGGSPKLSVVGGGESNTMNGSNAGIGGGYKNKVLHNNGVIGGGKENRIEGINGIIAGGTNNHSTYLGIILGGQDNEAVGGYPNMSNDYAIILGGKGNKANLSSLVLGSNAYGNPDSFAWNGHATTKSARIDATGGMLIGTYNPITGVSLVVSGSIKLSNPSGTPNSTGGVFLNTKGCIQFYDGNVYNTLGKASENNDYCGIDTGCQFGIATLHNGDIVTAYSVSYTGNCQNASGQVTCTNGNLVDNKGQTGVYVYPYCYNLSDDPIITVTKGYQTCSEGLPDNAEWVNQYFTQELDTNTNTYNSQPEAQFDPSGAKECSYDCKSGYEHENGSCVAKCIGGDEPDSNDPNIQKNTSTSQPQEWEYVNPGSELAACQWTCIGGAIREGNKCVPMDADACSTNITFPNGLCAEGEASDVSIEIQDINNFTKSAYGTWSCGNLSCGGRIPTATFNRELSGQDLKISINKYINRSNSRTYDSVNFSGVTVWFRHNEREKHPVIYNSISDIYTSRGDGGQYEFAGNPIRYGNKCRRRNGSEYNNCTTDSITPLFWAKDGYIMVEGNDGGTISCSTNPSFPDGLCTQGEASNIHINIQDSDNLTKSAYGTWKCGTKSCNGYLPTATFNFKDVKDNHINTHLLVTINKNKNGNNVNRNYDNVNFSGTVISTRDNDGAGTSYLTFTSQNNSYQFNGFGGIDFTNTFIFYGNRNKCRSYTGIKSNNCEASRSTPTFGTKDGYILLPGGTIDGDAAYLLPGQTINDKLKSLAGDLSNIKYFKYDCRNGLDVNNVISTPDSPFPVYVMYENNIIRYCSEADTIYMNEDSSKMFKDCTNLESVDVENLNTNNVKNMNSMFYGCSKLKDTGISTLSNWTTNNVTDMGSMFRGCKTLTNISALSNWNTSNVTGINHIFHDCESLTNISALSNWNTSSVTNMAGVFYNCLRLTNISALSNWNTSKVTTMGGLFNNCETLTNISALSNWNTSNVTGMAGMFYNTNLTNISALSNWKTNKVTSMSEMFMSCSNLTDAEGLSNWNTSKVKDMSRIFSYCSKLTNLNLSNWNTSSVTNMNEMFYNCPKLETIFASESFKTSNVSNSTNMFHNSTKITGGQGTTYSGSHVDKEYARLDCGPSKPGYFTSKNNDYSSCVEGTFHNTTSDDSSTFDMLGYANIPQDPRYGCVKDRKYHDVLNSRTTYECSKSYGNTNYDYNTIAIEIIPGNYYPRPTDYHEYTAEYTVTKENMPGCDGSFITDVRLCWDNNANNGRIDGAYYICATATGNQNAINYYNNLKDENGIIPNNPQPYSQHNCEGAYIRITAPDGTYEQYPLIRNNYDYSYNGGIASFYREGDTMIYTSYRFNLSNKKMFSSIDYYGPSNRTITDGGTFGNINLGGSGPWNFYSILHSATALPNMAYPYDIYKTYHNKTSLGIPMSYLKLTQTNNYTY